MYKIEKREEYILVRFTEDFDFNVVQTVIHHVTSIREFPYTNDLWLIGKHRANIRLGELETMVREFHCHCPTEATRTKTAVVVEHGLTEAIIDLWMSAARKKVSFDMQIFDSFEAALRWLGVEQVETTA